MSREGVRQVARERAEAESPCDLDFVRGGRVVARTEARRDGREDVQIRIAGIEADRGGHLAGEDRMFLTRHLPARRAAGVDPMEALRSD
jgi:hypothetical protein